jgi:hypothetical protein
MKIFVFLIFLIIKILKIFKNLFLIKRKKKLRDFRNALIFWK